MINVQAFHSRPCPFSSTSPLSYVDFPDTGDGRVLFQAFQCVSRHISAGFTPDGDVSRASWLNHTFNLFHSARLGVIASNTALPPSSSPFRDLDPDEQAYLKLIKEVTETFDGYFSTFRSSILRETCSRCLESCAIPIEEHDWRSTGILMR
jgi:hypothetical protein